MAVVPFTPSACSERRRARRPGARTPLGRRALLAAWGVGVSSAAAAAQLLAGSAVMAQSRWLQGVFPVASFAGYTSHFGMRTGPGGRREPHYGLDIAAPMGSPIRSWWGGTVQDVINDGACGLGLVISSGPYEHIYCHLSGSVIGGVYRSGAVALASGSRVRGGQLIGHVGMSGRTTGPHLHWGVRHGGRWLDPGTILKAMAAARRR
ncbi:MAG: hypothetical protein RLZZ124_389 [Cyanobacteriota bacterium]